MILLSTTLSQFSQFYKGSYTVTLLGSEFIFIGNNYKYNKLNNEGFFTYLVYLQISSWKRLVLGKTGSGALKHCQGLVCLPLSFVTVLGICFHSHPPWTLRKDQPKLTVAISANPGAVRPANYISFLECGICLTSGVEQKKHPKIPNP